jgi:hypothetical protein
MNESIQENSSMSKVSLLTFLIVLTLIVSACKVTPGTTQTDVALPGGTPIEATPANTPSPVATGQTTNLPYTTSPSLTPTITTSPTSTSQAIVITTEKGNVFVRRGPDLAYNAVSVLMDGQSVMGLARDVLAHWVQIPIPGQSGKTGWISIQTHFVALSGDVMSLPEVTPTDWPVLAFLRNCTHDQMEADPGGIVIPAVDNFPDNDVQINPGIYTIHDTDIKGSPGVMKVEIKEGSAIDILNDGNGNHKKCPMP